MDNHAQYILETSIDIITWNRKAVKFTGDNDCGFRSFQIVYTSMDENEILGWQESFVVFFNAFILFFFF